MQTNHRCTRFVAIAVVFYGLLVLSEQFRFSNHASAQMYEGDSCESMNDLPGTCMEPQKCTWVQQNVIRKRQYSIYDVPICGFTVRASLICCPDESEIRRTLVGKADQACQNFARGSAFFATHIVEGNEAEFGEIPFIVALGYNSTDSDKEYDFRCGASWIAKNFLLTAAHCVSGRNQPSIARIGTLNLTESDASNFQDSKIKDCYPHPRYKPKLKYHDIALIELVTPFKYDDDGIVNKICLYTDPGDMDPRHVLTASGWGMTTEGDACTLKDGGAGICQQNVQCPWFLKNIIATKRYGDRVTCGFVDRTEIICCKIDQPVEPAKKPGVRSSQACQNIMDAAEAEHGTESPIEFHVVGGEEAPEGEFPFMAVLGYADPDTTGSFVYRCGASLISPNFLLTAAHCKYSDGEPEVALLGATSLNSTNGVKVGIKNFHRHPKYKGGSYNDIALVELENSLTNKPNICPICIRSDPEDLTSDVILSAQGFGMIDTDNFLFPNRMMTVNLTTVSLSKCKKFFTDITRKHRLPKGIIDTQYCARGSKSVSSTGVAGDTCQGDSGGPLTAMVGGMVQLVGVTSFGPGCGSDTPGVYTRVAQYIEWIEQMVWPDGV
nr:serine protease persephone-like [Aedes albopictus]